ncbi:predicted protein [Botrytis cinerea T4]|uniref:Uncharacterized protein n=1 Tax=Botryotinia fuckeliana (strain T4) TaxID=999810 RepID=G2Y1W0_BOTF4|nr:predicted protein [Botrytis cinerea T4]
MNYYTSMDLWSGFRIERVSRIALASIKMEIGSMLDSHTFKIQFSRRITQNHSLEGIPRGIQIRADANKQRAPTKPPNKAGAQPSAT